MRFFKLWEPLSIGNMELRNRIVMPAMHLDDADMGQVNPQLLEFYATRARGGVGLIIAGGIGIDHAGEGGNTMISIRDDSFIPGLQSLTERIHDEGAKICAQLYHAGAYAFHQLTGVESVSSSAVYSRFTHDTPRALETEEIVELEEIFAQAAGRAVDSNFDSIELLSSAGYLLDQFLSPIKNLRTDRYGGNTLEERMTFPLELIDKVKSAVGTKIVIGMRISGDDFVADSNTYHEKITVAKAYEQAGIQYLNVTGGWHETRVPQIPMDVPRGAFSYLAKEIKNVVSIPVFASNRINDPILADQLLQDFYADAICMGRPLIADPDLPIKVQQNRCNDIRKCLGCNCCFDNVFNMERVNCSMNPYAGNELQFSSPENSPTVKKVVIVGAGPAGLEAARTARIFGHDVILFDKEPEIGGQINVACVPPGREELKNLTSYYNQQIQNLGIKCQFGIEVTPEIIQNEHPDAVYFATGVIPRIPPIPGVDGSLGCDVCWADDALAGNALIGKRVVVVGGAATGIEVALWAARKGAMDPQVARFLAFYDALPKEEAITRTFRGDREVCLIEMLPKIGNSVGKSTRWVFLDKLAKLGVTVITNARITLLQNRSVTYILAETENTLDNIDTIILATGVKSNKELYAAYKESVECLDSSERPAIIEALGDAKKVGNILDAIHSGFRAAFKLGKVE